MANSIDEQNKKAKAQQQQQPSDMPQIDLSVENLQRMQSFIEGLTFYKKYFNEYLCKHDRFLRLSQINFLQNI